MSKIAFLFLIINSVYHEPYWVKFFAKNTDRYSIYVHSKEKIRSPFFAPYRIPVTVPTSWEHTMLAQIELLREALKDPNNKKFIFSSESTIPLADFNHVYDVICEHDQSMFEYKRNDHLGLPGEVNKKRRLIDIPNMYQKKHSQWIVLNREDAQLLTKHGSYLKKNPVFADNEHYAGTILAYYGGIDNVFPRATTFVYWSGLDSHPLTFTNLQNSFQKKLILDAKNKDFLFARKFAKTCDLRPIAHLLPYLHT